MNVRTVCLGSSRVIETSKERSAQNSRSPGPSAVRRCRRAVRVGSPEGWASGQGLAGTSGHPSPDTARTLGGQRLARFGAAVRGVRPGCARLAAARSTCADVERRDRRRRGTASRPAAPRPLLRCAAPQTQPVRRRHEVANHFGIRTSAQSKWNGTETARRL